MLVFQSIDEPKSVDSDSIGSDQNPSRSDLMGPSLVEPPDNPTKEIDWTALVSRIQANEQEAQEELYNLFSRGIKFLIVRQLGRQDIEDRVHDTFVIVVQAIQRGDLREPERLMGFVRTIVRRQISAFIEKNYTKRRDELDIDGNVKIADRQVGPEEQAIRLQNSKIMEEILRDCSRRDREILTRFYLLEQSQQQICDEMGLNDTQFRLLKSRAKQRFSDEGRRRMAKNNLKSFFVRKRAAS
jgi:RNA polymerase sigma-70 factor, ECF subfamily